MFLFFRVFLEGATVKVSTYQKSVGRGEGGISMYEVRSCRTKGCTTPRKDGPISRFEVLTSCVSPPPTAYVSHTGLRGAARPAPRLSSKGRGGSDTHRFSVCSV